MNKIITTLAVLPFALFSFAALAHPGIHGEERLVAGLLHQFTEMDHLNTFLVAAFGVALTAVVFFMQRRDVKARLKAKK